MEETKVIRVRYLDGRDETWYNIIGGLDFSRPGFVVLTADTTKYGIESTKEFIIPLCNILFITEDKDKW